MTGEHTKPCLLWGSLEKRGDGSVGKVLAGQHEKLNSHAQHPHKNQMCPSVAPALVGARDSGSQDLTGQSAKLSNSRFPESLSQRK